MIYDICGLIKTHWIVHDYKPATKDGSMGGLGGVLVPPPPPKITRKKKLKAKKKGKKKKKN
jgi:hypothetical protein